MISLQELLEKKKRESYSENWLAEIHDLLMCEYGWIPFEEFKRQEEEEMKNFNLEKTFSYAQYTIENNGTKEEFYDKIDEFMSQFS